MAFILHAGATITCMHAGQVQPAATNPRVKVSNQPITTLSNTYTVGGCTNPPPNVNVGPCVTAQFTNGATRVRANGEPALFSDSSAVCTPTGTGVNILNTQQRVKAT